MSESFNIEIVNPEKSFLSKDNISEVVVPAFEGEIGILKDHISIISLLKPGIVKVITGSEEENYYVEDGIVEFKNNSLSILTSYIFNIKNAEKNQISNFIEEAEKELSKNEIDDQNKFLLNHKLEVLKSLSFN
jgi:ATP synthase F1 epsilon subunit|tara:strand:+ start:264 stop:662 length:399 start_codon:yes stop_codon:yes gene_type:complete